MTLQTEFHRLREEVDNHRGEDWRPRHRDVPWLEFGQRPVAASYVANLSDALVADLRKVVRETFIRDSKVEFLALRLRPDRRASYVYFQYSSKGSLERKTAIGPIDAFSVDQARVQALRIEAQRYTASGPAKRAHGLSKSASANVAWQSYLRAHPHIRNCHHLTRLLAPYLTTWGTKRLSQARRQQLLLLIQQAALEDPSRAHELHKRMRAFFSWCVRAGALDANPIRDAVMPERTASTTRALSLPELGKVYGAISELNPPWRHLLQFVMTTGANVDEARKLRIQDIDFDVGSWTRGSTKCRDNNGQEPLSSLSLQILQGKEPAQIYCFGRPKRPRQKGGVHLRPTLLSRLHDSSGVTGWTWRDLVKAVRHHMRSGTPNGPSFEERRAVLEGWAESLRWAESFLPPNPEQDVVL